HRDDDGHPRAARPWLHASGGARGATSPPRPGGTPYAGRPSARAAVEGAEPARQQGPTSEAVGASSVAATAQLRAAVARRPERLDASGFDRLRPRARRTARSTPARAPLTAASRAASLASKTTLGSPESTTLTRTDWSTPP